MENLQKKLKNNYNIITFFIYASINKIKERLHARCTENEKNLEIRIKQISKEIKQKNNFNYKILNNKIELAINKINKIIKSYV
jgi:guanylate kinase